VLERRAPVGVRLSRRRSSTSGVQLRRCPGGNGRSGRAPAISFGTERRPPPCASASRAATDEGGAPRRSGAAYLPPGAHPQLPPHHEPRTNGRAGRFSGRPRKARARGSCGSPEGDRRPRASQGRGHSGGTVVSGRAPLSRSPSAFDPLREGVTAGPRSCRSGTGPRRRTPAFRCARARSSLPL